MKILFLGGLFNEEQKAFVFENSKKMPNLAANVHQWNIINGIKCELNIINPLFVGNYPFEFKKMFTKEFKWSHDGTSSDVSPKYCNIYAIKQFFKKKAIYHHLVEWVNKNNYSDSIILIYTLDYAFLSAVQKAAKNFKGKTCVIVPDLPIFFANTKGKTAIYNCLKRIEWKKILKKCQFIDSFILLTKEMADVLNVGDRPFLISEGICDNYDNCQIETKDISENTITYTGSLDKEFGITELIDTFNLIKNKNYILQIAGDGNSKQYVVNASKTNKNIKYFGVLSREETIQLQAHSKILINPRTNAGLFTKYSFPSKTMEYLKSGRPTLMHRLDGVPHQYDDYLLYFDCNTIENMAKRIESVLSMSGEELDTIGHNGKEFVEREKNSNAIGKKITSFFERIISN